VTGRSIPARAELDSIRQGNSEKTGISTGILSDDREFEITSLQSDWTLNLREDRALEIGGIVASFDGRYTYTDSVANVSRPTSACGSTGSR